MRCFALTMMGTLLFATPGMAQGPDPAALIAAYKQERVSVANRAAADVLASADDLIRKAAAAKSPAAALRLIREARWKLPFFPPNLPAHVVHVLGGTRLRHQDRINSLAYGRNGQTLLAGSRDGTVRLWDLSAGRELWIYRALGSIAPPAEGKVQDDVLKVASVAFSPDGATVAAAGYNEIHLLKMADGTFVKALKEHKGQTKGIAFSSDGTLLASVGDDKMLRIWNVKSGDVRLKQDLSKIAGPGNPVGRFESIAFSPTAPHVALTNADGKLVVYDISGKDAVLKQSATIVNSSTAVYCVKFTPDGTGLVTGSEDTTPPRLTAAPAPDAPLANPTPGVMASVRNFPGAKRRTTSLDLTPDGQLLVTGGEDAVVRVFEINTGRQLKQFSAHTTEVTAVAVRPDGGEVATADDAGIIRLWPLAANDEHQKVETSGTVWATAASPGGKRMAAAGADRVVRVYDAATTELLKEFTGHTAAVGALTFLNETALASAGGDRLIRLWDMSRNDSPKSLEGHRTVVLALAAGDGGRVLYSGSIDKTVMAWDVATGKRLGTYDAKSAVCAIAVKDSRLAIGTADGWITILDASQPESMNVLFSTGSHTSGVAAVAFTPDGNLLLTAGGDGQFRVWSVGSNNGVLTSKATFEAVMNASTSQPFALSAIAIAPDGKSAAFAGQDGLIRLYDPVGLRETRSLRGHGDWVTGLAFVEGSSAVVGVSADKSVRKFPLAQDAVAAVPGHIRAAGSVCVSPDGKTAVTIGPDEWKIWNLANGKETAVHPAPTFRVNTAMFTSPTEFLLAGDSEKLNWYSTVTGQRTRSESVGGNQAYSVATNGSDVGVWQSKSDASEFVTIRGGKISEPFKLPGDKQPEQKVLCATIAPDATLAFAAQADKNVQIVNLTTRQREGELWPLFAGEPVDINILPDKSKLITIDAAGTIQVASVAERKVVARAKAHESGCNGIIVAKSNDRFATLGSDGEIKAWDLNAKELRSWKMPVEVKSAMLTPDGRSLVTVNGDGTAYVLAVP
jgi:WD40 repeat protein